MLYSFDVFDTCLIRTCGKPVVVFEILAKEILQEYANSSSIADFRYARQKGEQKAREVSLYEEVTLEEIYEYCDFGGITDIPKVNIMAKELEVEERVLSPIFEIQQKLEYLRNKGNQIAFITDMYLDKNFISKILFKFNIAKRGDDIFVSSEYRVTKASGRLFDVIFREKGCRPYFWQHYGDNFHSDFISPFSKGIFSHYIKHNYSLLENKMIQDERNPSMATLSLSAAISKAISYKYKSDSIVKIAVDLLAPLYVSFTYMILNDARKRGIKRLYFIARDGYILYKIAKRMQSFFEGIEVKFLYASRKALYLPALDEITEDTIKSILNLYGNGNPKSLFDNLQIDIDNSKYKNMDVNTLLKDNEIRQKIIARWNEQKENCFGYLCQEGLASREKEIAIVDIRGTRKCQESISHILEIHGFQRVFAYYLEADLKRISPKYANEYVALFYGDYKETYGLKNIEAMAVFFERYFCMSQLRRTAGYKKDIENHYSPIFEDVKKTVNMKEVTIQKVNESVCAEYCKMFLELHAYDYACDIASSALNNIALFSSNPQKEYLKAFTEVDFSETSFEKRPIIANYSYLFSGGKVIWLSGTIKELFGYFSPVVKKSICTFKKYIYPLIKKKAYEKYN